MHDSTCCIFCHTCNIPTYSCFVVGATANHDKTRHTKLFCVRVQIPHRARDLDRQLAWLLMSRRINAVCSSSVCCVRCELGTHGLVGACVCRCARTGTRGHASAHARAATSPCPSRRHPPWLQPCQLCFHSWCAPWRRPIELAVVPFFFVKWWSWQCQNVNFQVREGDDEGGRHKTSSGTAEKEFD